jgi:hypothetical protein
MDDFRVGSIPSAEPFGDRHPYGVAGRRRQKHHGEDGGHEEEDPADTFEASADEAPPATAEEEVKDYYLPAEPAADDE